MDWDTGIRAHADTTTSDSPGVHRAQQEEWGAAQPTSPPPVVSPPQGVLSDSDLPERLTHPRGSSPTVTSLNG